MPVPHPLVAQFRTAVDQYAWNLHYDSLSTEFSSTGVDIVAVCDAAKQRNVNRAVNSLVVGRVVS